MKMRRREWLSMLGLGGLASALPFGGIRTQRLAKAQSTAPTRFVVMFTSNGTYWPEWFPRGSERDFELGRILQPLERHQDRLIVFGSRDNTPTDWRDERGISMKSNPEREPQGGHGLAWLLTGVPPAEYEGQEWASGPSVDQLIADAIGGDTRFRSLELGVRVQGRPGSGQRLSYRGPGQPLPAENDAALVWDRLFADFMSEGEDDTLLRAAQARRAAVLEFVESGLVDLQGAAADPRRGLFPRSDDELIAAHLASLEPIRSRLDAPIEVPAVCAPPARPVIPDARWDDYSNMPDIARAQIDNMVAAFGCDMTRVATLQITEAASNARHPFLMGADGLPIEDWHHALSHASHDDTPKMEKLIAIGRWHAEQLAYLMDSLGAVTDIDGRTLLDNTVILWAQELSEARFHTHQNMPFLLAGGGGLDTGRYMQLEDETHNDLLVTCMQACGVEANTIGDPALCSGGIDGVLT